MGVSPDCFIPSSIEGVWRWISEHNQGQPLKTFPQDTGAGSQMQPYYCFNQGKMYHALKASGYPAGSPQENGIFQMPESWEIPYIFQGNMLMNFNVTFNGNEMTLEIPGKVTLKMERVSNPTAEQILEAKPMGGGGTGEDNLIISGDSVVGVRDKTKLTGTLILPDTITKIGDKAFKDCTGLTGITVPDSVTQIGKQAFYGCTLLTNITIGTGVTDVGSYAFKDCTNLTKAVINCTTVPELGIRSLKEAVLGNTVTKIGDSAFNYCNNLTSIIIPDSVTTIGNGAFAGCSKLASITIPDSVTTIGSSVFSTCKGLKNVTIGKGVTRIGDNLFFGCTDIEKLTINCTPAHSFGIESVKEVIIGDNVTRIYKDFNYCKNLTSLTVDPANKTYCSENNVIYDKNKKRLINAPGGLTSVIIPTSVTVIEEQALRGCTLTSVSFPASLTRIGIQAFYGCKGLTSISLPANLTTIDAAFSCCTGLTSISLPASLTYIGSYTFHGCTGLTSAVFADKNGWAVYNDFDAQTASISSSDLADPSTAAKYLREYVSDGGYSNVTWKKN